MTEVTNTWIDKSDWFDGPWKTEPDKAQWVDQDTGLTCLIVRNHAGALCGYVGVPKDHKCYQKDYYDIKDKDGEYIDVHGGLTYSNKCVGEPDTGICHKVDHQDDIWWFGFDCAHGGDYSPKIESVLSKLPFSNEDRSPEARAAHGRFGRSEIYKDISYVKEQCNLLAMQLKDVG